MDTGTGADVRQIGGMGVRSAGEGLPRLKTAGGIITPSSTVKCGIDLMEEDVECLELQDTVNALSMGKRCAKYG